MNVVHQSVDKIDGMGSVLGRPVYAEDLAPADALCVKFLRSPHAYARIRSIQKDAAMKVPGMVLILTHQDCKPILHTIAAEAYPEGSPYDRYLLEDTVRYVGDPVAVVAGETEQAVLEAMRLIEVDYEVLTPILDFEQALDNPIVLHQDVFTNLPVDNDPARNIAASFPWTRGDVDAELKKSDAVVKSTYYVQAQLHAMTETHRAFSYYDARGILTIVSSCQSPFHVQRIVSKTLEIPQYKIRVIKPKVGGAFGGKNSTFIEPFIAWVTKLTGRPAQMIFDRRESLTCTNTRHCMRIQVTMGGKKDGTINAIRLEVLANTGAYGEHAIDVLAVACKNTLPMYSKISAVDYYGVQVYTNLVPGGAYRGFGGAQSNFAIECAANELAHKLGIDPIALRKKNIIEEGESHPFLAGGSPTGDAIVRSTTLARCIDKGRELIGWDSKYPCRELDGDRVRGVGMSVAMHGSSIGGMDVADAEVRLNYDGGYTVFSGASDLGTGAETILCQIAAEALCTDMDHVRIVAADTGTTPYDKGAYASSSTYASGNAVMKAAQKLKAELLRGAKLVLRTEEEILFDGRCFQTSSGKTLSLSEYLTKVTYWKFAPDYFADEKTMPQLSASARHGGPTSPPPFVAGFAEVEVDRRTGKVTLIDYAEVVDCGTVINPKLARIQVEGGLVQGMGYALFEEIRYDKRGRMLSDSYTEYQIPRRLDIPRMQVAFEESCEPTGPYGAKSLGEVVFHTPASAIEEAIYNAVGVRLRSLPMTPEKVLAAIREKEGRQ